MPVIQSEDLAKGASRDGALSSRMYFNPLSIGVGSEISYFFTAGSGDHVWYGIRAERV